MRFIESIKIKSLHVIFGKMFEHWFVGIKSWIKYCRLQVKYKNLTLFSYSVIENSKL